MTKLLFTGVATGVALSCAFVLATSLPTQNIEASQPTAIQSTATAKADRIAGAKSPQRVVRELKSDPLTLTLSILRGKDFVPDDQVRFGTDRVAAIDSTLDEAVQPAPLANRPALPAKTATADKAGPATIIPAKSRRLTAIATPGGPLSIIPIPEPVESEPVSAAETATNFAADPFGNARTPGHQDLVR